MGRPRTSTPAWALAACLALAASACRTPLEGAELEAAQREQHNVQDDECVEPRRKLVDPTLPYSGYVPGRMDWLQSALARRLKLGATWVDGFLGDERSIAEVNETWARLRLNATIEDREGFGGGASFKTRLVLPNTEDRLHLVLAGIGDESNTDDYLFDEQISDEFSGVEEESVSAGLQYFLKATNRNNLRLELGARFSGGTPDPYTGFRYRHSVPLDVWLLRLTERLRVFVERGWESQTRFDVERPFGSRFYFRTTSRVDAFEEEEGVFLGQDLILHQRLSRLRLMTYELVGDLATDSVDELDQVVARVRYSQRLARSWIRLEVAPQLAWRERYDFATTAGLLLRLDLEIGRLD